MKEEIINMKNRKFSIVNKEILEKAIKILKEKNSHYYTKYNILNIKKANE